MRADHFRRLLGSEKRAGCTNSNTGCGPCCHSACGLQRDRSDEPANCAINQLGGSPAQPKAGQQSAQYRSMPPALPGSPACEGGCRYPGADLRVLQLAGRRHARLSVTRLEPIALPGAALMEVESASRPTQCPPAGRTGAEEPEASHVCVSEVRGRRLRRVQDRYLPKR